MTPSLFTCYRSRGWKSRRKKKMRAPHVVPRRENRCSACGHGNRIELRTLLVAYVFDGAVVLMVSDTLTPPLRDYRGLRGEPEPEGKATLPGRKRQ